MLSLICTFYVNQLTRIFLDYIHDVTNGFSGLDLHVKVISFDCSSFWLEVLLYLEVNTNKNNSCK